MGFFRKIGLFHVALSLAAAGIGCAVDQAEEVAQYRQIVEIDAPQEAFIVGEPLSLNEALMLANRQNEQLSIEGENYLQALIERRRAIASFLPTINLSPTYARRDAVGDAGDGAGGVGGGTAQDSSFDVALTGDINLFNGLRDVARLQREAATIEQRRALLLDFQEVLLLDVARVYYQILRAELSTHVLENSLRVQQERVRDTRGRQQAGVARPLDVAQTEAQASATRVALIAARNDVQNGRAILAFLTASPVESSPLIDQFPLPSQVASIQELNEAALWQRQDLAAARDAVRAARQNVEVAFGQYYPSLSLNVNAFLYRETTPDERNWDAFLRANLPIFSAGLIEADVRDAWSQFRQAVLFMSLLRRQIQQEVEVAMENLSSSEQRLAEIQIQLTAAEQAFRQAEQSYNIGLATNLERITAQDQLLNAQLLLAGELFDRKLFYLDLLRATGQMRESALTPAALMPATEPADFPAHVPATRPVGPIQLQPTPVRPLTTQPVE